MNDKHKKRIMKKVKNISILIGVILAFTGCSSSSQEAEEDLVIEQFIDAELIGEWSGEATGTFGDATMTLTTMEDGKAILNVLSGSPNYCPIPNLKWFVMNNSFKMEGNANCDGTFVTFDAPYSKTKLVGAWISVNGNGSFAFTKQ